MMPELVARIGRLAEAIGYTDASAHMANLGA